MNLSNFVKIQIVQTFIKKINMKPEQTENKQIELTDEEIFKAVNSLIFNLDQEECFIMGAKWYREQLKQPKKD